MKKNPSLILVLFFLVFFVTCKSTPEPGSSGQHTGTPAAMIPVHRSGGPQLRVTFSPDYFSPGSGDLAIYLLAVDESSVTGWKIEIIEPGPPRHVFNVWEGQGRPPEMISWNGRNTRGDLVKPDTDYHFIFSASNALGNNGVHETLLKVIR